MQECRSTTVCQAKLVAGSVLTCVLIHCVHSPLTPAPSIQAYLKDLDLQMFRYLPLTQVPQPTALASLFPVSQNQAQDTTPPDNQGVSSQSHASV